MVLRLMYEPQELVDTSNLSNEEWLSYRRRGIGGSNAAAILGISPWRTAWDLYYDKLSVVKADMDENWVALEMGHLLENLVARIFAKKTGLRIFQRKVMFQHPLYPWMLADLDYLVELPDGSNAICKRQIVVNQRQRKAVTGSGFAYCLHGWQPWQTISRQAAARQCGQEIFQIACRVQSVGLCGLDQRIDHCADLRAKRRIAEQPVLSSNGKRPNRALCAVVGQLQPSAAENVHQPALLPQGITKRCAIETLWHRIFLIFRLRPPEKFLGNWLGLLLPLRILLFRRKCLL